MYQIVPLIKKNFVFIWRGHCSLFFHVYSPLVVFLLLSVVMMGLYYPEGNYIRFDYSLLKSSMELSSSTYNDYSFDSIAVISLNQTIGNHLIQFSQEERICNVSTCNSYLFSSIEQYEAARKEGFEVNFIIEILKDKEGNISFNLHSNLFSSINEKLIQINSNDLIAPGELFYETKKIIIPLNTLQLFFAKFLIKYHNKEMRNKVLRINTMPLSIISSYTKTSIYYFSFLPIVYSFLFLFNFTRFTQLMLEEKETQVKTLLFSNGVSHYTYFISWNITFILIEFIPISLTALLLQKTLFTFIGFWIIFSSMLLLENSLFFIMFILHLIFKTSNSSPITIKIVYIILTFATPLTRKTNVAIYFKLILSFFPPTLFLMAFDILQIINTIEINIDCKLFFAYYNSFSLFSISIIYLIDIVIYFLISLFIIRVNDNKLSLPQNLTSIIKRKPIILSNQIDFTLKNKDEQYYEPVRDIGLSSSENNTLVLENVTKTYKEVSVVNAINLNLSAGEIFCLFGHKGAGKSTILKIIGGREIIDYGNLYFKGKSVLNNNEIAYKNTSLCSQEIILMSAFTVEEHFTLLSQLSSNSLPYDQINNLIKLIQLDDKKTIKVSDLLKEEKKLLCIALSLIKDSSILLLDEPTDGLSFESKKLIWDYIKQIKKHKIILFTTQSIEEAEYFSERMGILHEGTLICLGTFSYIKSKYPCGIDITFIKDKRIKNQTDTMQLIQYLKRFNNESLNIKRYKREYLVVNYQSLPNDIDKILKYISQNKEQYGIIDYSILTCSLDDMFIKCNTNGFNNNSIQNNNDSSISHQNYYDAKVFNQKISMINELYINVKRNLITLFRTKTRILIEIIISVVTAIILVWSVRLFLISSFFPKIDINSFLNHSNEIYYSYSNSTIEHSDYFNLNKYHKLTFNQETIGNIRGNIKALDIELYFKSKYHLEKSIIFIQAMNEGNLTVDNLYTPLMWAFLPASNNLLLTSFLKHEYNIESNLIQAYSPIYPLNTINLYLDNYLRLFVIILIVTLLITLSGFNLLMPLKERIHHIKQLHVLSGNRLVVYWFSFYLSDIIRMILFLIVLTPAMMYLFKCWFESIVIICSFVFANNIFVYLFSFAIDETKGLKRYFYVSYLGTVMVFIVLNARMFLIDDQTLSLYNETIVLPSSNLCLSLWQLSIKSRELNDSNQSQIIQNDIRMIMNKNLIISFFHCIISVLIIILIEINLFETIFFKCKIRLNKLKSKSLPKANGLEKKIALVEVEDNYNNNNDNSPASTPVIINNLFITNNHFAKSNYILQDLSLCLDDNEAFGFFGNNQIEKKTLIKALIKEINIDSGSIIYNNQDINTQFDLVKETIGYCPQNNALFDHLTAYETLSYYAQLKGNTHLIRDIVQRYSLSDCLDTCCIDLSLRNKKKLQLVLALINSPKIIVLEEPTKGLDLKSKRIIWNLISNIEKSNSHYSLLLSTDSIEEAELLCDRIGWIDQKRFNLVDNPECFKLKYCSQYRIDICFNDNSTKSISIQLTETEIEDLIQLIDQSYQRKNITTIDSFKQSLLTHSSTVDFLNIINQLKQFCETIKLLPIQKSPSVFTLQCLPIEKYKNDFFFYLLSFQHNDKKNKDIEISIKI